MAVPFLEGLSPLLMGHGVLVGMGVSGVAYGLVSLLTPAPAGTCLAPFFEDEARKLAAAHAGPCERDEASMRSLAPQLLYRPNGERTLIRTGLRAKRPFEWPALVEGLKRHNPAWRNPAGYDAVYRLTDPDLLGCVVVTRGRLAHDILIQAEPLNAAAEVRRAEVAAAYRELQAALG
jgi:SSS family solute:Na+ symporter